MLKHLVDIMIRALGWGTGILIMSVCFISFIVWEIKHHPKQFRISKLAIGIPSTNQQIHTDRPPLNCRD